MENKLYVLLVDDNKELCNIIKEYLGRRGFVILVANTAREAMEILEKASRIDAILLDLMLPDMDGLEILKTIREYSKNVVIIVITGIKDLNIVIEAMKAGADDYLVKPFRLGELEEKIKDILYKKVKEESQHNVLTAERAMEVVNTIDYTGGMLKFSFENIDELESFLKMLKQRDDVKINDVRIGEEYEVFLTLKR